MTHDPLCPWKCDCGEVHNEMDCEQCHLITKVREDAIAAAVQRVEALWSIDASWDGTNWNNALHAAIAAIKGDQP